MREVQWGSEHHEFELQLVTILSTQSPLPSVLAQSHILFRGQKTEALALDSLFKQAAEQKCATGVW